MAYPSVKIDGEPFSGARLITVNVFQTLNEHWWAVLTCGQASDDPISAETWLSKSLSVRSLDAAGAAQTHFAGFVLSVKVVDESSGTYTAQVTAVSQTWLLDQAMRKQYYAEQGLAAVAGQIAARAGLDVSVQVPDGKPLNYVQYGETDFNLLHRIVDDHNAWLRPSEDGLEIFNAFQPGTELVWRGESGLGLLHFELAGTLKPPSFDGSHYDFHTMTSQSFSGVSKPAEFFPSQSGMAESVQRNSNAVMPAGFAQQRARVMSLEEYRLSLEDESERSIGSAVTGTGVSRQQGLMAGNTVNLTGTLPAAGMYGLTRVAHRWTAAGYVNDFVCTPWKKFRNAEEPALRSWNGVVPARVVDHNDPGKMGRIKVQFFWQEDGCTHWARATSPHAGPDRGFMFLPEIGDEVAVAFEDGDPERPIILGSMWNGVQQAPRYDLRGDDVGTNDVKRLITKAGNRFQASDKPGKETVILATPNQTQLHMTENHDSTSRPMVTLHSSGDIFLSAPNGRVHINSLYFSRDVGPAPSAPVSAGRGAAAAADAEQVAHAGNYPNQPGPCAGQGMDNEADRQQFAARMKQLQADWPNLTPDRRAARLVEAGNEQTAKQGVPPMQVATQPMGAGTHGTFNGQTWTMTVNSNLVNQPTLTDQDAASTGDTVYHETRHSETSYAAARNEAANSSDLAKQNQTIPIKPSVNAEAMKHPLKFGAPGWACAEAVKQSTYGPGRSARNKTMRDLP